MTASGAPPAAAIPKKVWWRVIRAWAYDDVVLFLRSNPTEWRAIEVLDGGAETLSLHELRLRALSVVLRHRRRR